MKPYQFILRTLLMVALLSSAAHADTLCVKKKTKANKKNLAVAIAKAFKTVPTGQPCPRGFVTLVDTSAFSGPAGPAGPAGTSGTNGLPGVPGAPGAPGTNGTNGFVPLGSCILESVTAASCPEGTVCTTDLICGTPGTNGSQANDYMIQYFFDLSNDAAYVVATDFFKPTGLEYPTGMRIVTTSEETWGAHTPALGIICCLTN